MFFELLASAGASLLGSGVSKAINKPDDSAQKAQIEANERSQEFIEKQAEKAERTGEKLFDLSKQNLLAGNSAALDIYRDAINPSIDVIRQGNQQAQAQIAGGLPQIQNALMGLPVDYSAFQPRTVTPDTSFFDNYRINHAMAGTPEAHAQDTFNNHMALLGLPQKNFGVRFGSASQALALSPQEAQAQAQEEQKKAEQARINDAMSQAWKMAWR